MASSGRTKPGVDGAGQPFNPGNYYYVGGNSKLYGAVLLRYRAEDFAPDRLSRRSDARLAVFLPKSSSPGIVSPRSSTTSAARLGSTRTEPNHSAPYPFAPVPDEPAIAKVRERLKRVGLRPFPLPLGVDVEKWLARAKTPWDAFPDTGTGKMDAESCGLGESSCSPQCRIA